MAATTAQKKNSQVSMNAHLKVSVRESELSELPVAFPRKLMRMWCAKPAAATEDQEPVKKAARTEKPAATKKVWQKPQRELNTREEKLLICIHGSLAQSG